MEESFMWCLENAIELLEFTKRLPDGEGFKWWYGMLWFHFEKLDPIVQGEVERIAREMLPGDGHLALDMYLNLIHQEVEKTQRMLDEINTYNGHSEPSIVLRDWCVMVEGNHRRLAQITGRQ
jgi:hypothetical protein